MVRFFVIAMSEAKKQSQKLYKQINQYINLSK